MNNYRYLHTHIHYCNYKLSRYSQDGLQPGEVAMPEGDSIEQRGSVAQQVYKIVKYKYLRTKIILWLILLVCSQ